MKNLQPIPEGWSRFRRKRQWYYCYRMSYRFGNVELTAQKFVSSRELSLAAFPIRDAIESSVKNALRCAIKGAGIRS